MCTLTSLCKISVDYHHRRRRRHRHHHNHYYDFYFAEIQGDISSKPIPPFAEAKVTCCTTFAVICRLKSYTYLACDLENSNFTCIIQEHPDVSVTIPGSVVQANKELQLTLKVYFPNSSPLNHDLLKYLSSRSNRSS